LMYWEIINAKNLVISTAKVAKIPIGPVPKNRVFP
jgi:hypothetical protein